jgi:hypothetical protein
MLIERYRGGAAQAGKLARAIEVIDENCTRSGKAHRLIALFAGFSARPERLLLTLSLAVPLSAAAQQSQKAGSTSEAEGVLDAPATLALGRERILADMARLPRYTCVQTITRRYYRPQSRSKGQSCTDLIAAHVKRDHDVPIQRWDRLRLEVAVANNSNVYSWVGAPRFEKDALDKLAGRGPLGTGDFGPFLNSVFDHATVWFRQVRVVNGQRLFEYAYEMPESRSGYNIKTADGWAVTGYSGTFVLSRSAPGALSSQAPPVTADQVDVVKLTVRTAELPENANACQAISDVEYGRISIHDRMVLMPRETRLLTIGREGAEISSVSDFDRCREWASTITLHYDVPETNPQETRVPAPHLPPAALAPGLRFEARIVTPIDFNTAAAGDPIQASLRSQIRDKSHGTIAQAGARLNGRLVRVEEQSEIGPYFQIGVQWESLEINGQKAPMRAVPAVIPRHGYAAMRFDGPFSLSQSDSSEGIGTYIFPSGPSARILRELDSAWVTVAVDGEGKDSRKNENK